MIVVRPAAPRSPAHVPERDHPIMRLLVRLSRRVCARLKGGISDVAGSTHTGTSSIFRPTAGEILGCAPPTSER